MSAKRFLVPAALLAMAFVTVCAITVAYFASQVAFHIQTEDHEVVFDLGGSPTSERWVRDKEYYRTESVRYAQPQPLVINSDEDRQILEVEFNWVELTPSEQTQLRDAAQYGHLYFQARRDEILAQKFDYEHLTREIRSVAYREDKVNFMATWNMFDWHDERVREILGQASLSPIIIDWDWLYMRKLTKADERIDEMIGRVKWPRTLTQRIGTVKF
ncbi:MAG: hypothetical protein AAB642_00905 [Patescibacteria group bacterium]